MTETSYTERRAEVREGLEARVQAGLSTTGLTSGEPTVASVHVEEIEYAYPIPTVGRDEALAVIQPWLMQQRILSRGRFGSWLYEIGNMDHAVKMGIDAARGLVVGSEEEVWRLTAGGQGRPGRPETERLAAGVPRRSG